MPATISVSITVVLETMILKFVVAGCPCPSFPSQSPAKLFSFSKPIVARLCAHKPGMQKPAIKRTHRTNLLGFITSHLGFRGKRKQLLLRRRIFLQIRGCQRALALGDGQQGGIELDKRGIHSPMFRVAAIAT